MKTGQVTALRGKLVVNLSLLSHDDQRPRKRYPNLKILRSQHRITVERRSRSNHAMHHATYLLLAIRLWATGSESDRKWNSDDFSLRRFVLYVYDTWARFCRIFVVRLIILINHRSLNHILINQPVFLKIQIVCVGIKIRSTRNRRKRTHKLVFILILHLILIVHDFN